ncbi:Inositol 2-dehydrogenase [Posidoniimonas polymericola]|uniref:Inositol 2-dehydrogenase n=1 Tax=Posidoniimonas polymericola TaxID=2528002 RepID=A0A5C5YSQ2_9BACT|nr:Gfo/Idh/MocA family oxidoreductase [Posidoniimonas polymericola]TWT77790.1 Inositol 2-dehydrogenase [Posidoniimonas polymericola]
MSHSLSRRRFLQSSALAGAGFWVTGSLGAQQPGLANSRPQFACIGVGGKGSSDSADAARFGDVVAICDIDANTLNSSGDEKHTGAERFADFREMLDKLGDKIDGVTVSTPDHTHAVAAAAAMRLGKHVYCQKPLTHSIWEARRLTEIAAEAGVATQMGNQGAALEAARRSQAVIQSGVLGKVREVHAWTDRCGGWWPQGVDRPAAAEAPPHVSWDLFLGPAPSRPFSPLYHPFKWRGWWDFGTGALGDMACHVLNMPFHALELRDPVAVQATTSGHNRDSYPNWSVIDFEFPSNDSRDALKLTWYDGGKRPDPALVGSEGELPGNGVIVVAENATLYSPDAYGSNFEIIGDLETPEVEFERSPGHFDEWVRAIGGGAAGASNFADTGGPLTETVLLGNLAVWAAHEADTPGQRVEWDAQSMTPTNAPELAAIVRPELQHGYEL